LLDVGQRDHALRGQVQLDAVLALVVTLATLSKVRALASFSGSPPLVATTRKL
jgi:hypothetical protein